MNNDQSISDFEYKILLYYTDGNFEFLLEAAVEYCELYEVDYEEVMKTVKFTSSFKEKLGNEARKHNLLKESKPKHNDLDMS